MQEACRQQQTPLVAHEQDVLLFLIKDSFFFSSKKENY